MRTFFTKKRIVWGVVILIIAGLIGSQIYRAKNSTDGILTETVKIQDLKSTVLATGKVTSNVDLSLSFNTSGIVRRVNVKVGDKVKAGQLLATINQKDELASLTSARASVASAQANYQKVIDGNSSEKVAVAQVAYDNAVRQQKLAVENALRTLLNTGLIAEAKGEEGGTVPTISGTYNGTLEGQYKLRVIYSVNHGDGFYLSGLEAIKETYFDDNLPEPLGTLGLFVTFPGDQVTDDEWIVNIPNKKATNYVANYNAYQAALRNRDAVIASAQADLDLAKAKAQPADVKAAQAQMLSAQGQLQAAQAAFESTEIRAPAGGTVTSVDVKIGEVANALTPVITIQDVNNLYLEANISEANIASVKKDQKVEVTFDAISSEGKFSATVLNVEPASTVISGVVNYKVTAILSQVEEIKPGMTANMSILTGEKLGVLAIPIRAVISEDGKKLVKVVTDTKSKKYEQVEVTTGFEADGGLVEILSGLSADQEIITFIKE